jgi:hypothetical protein
MPAIQGVPETPIRYTSPYLRFGSGSSGLARARGGILRGFG